jgi:hypothetical protein
LGKISSLPAALLFWALLLSPLLLAAALVLSSLLLPAALLLLSVGLLLQMVSLLLLFVGLLLVLLSLLLSRSSSSSWWQCSLHLLFIMWGFSLLMSDSRTGFRKNSFAPSSRHLVQNIKTVNISESIQR